MAFLDRFRKHGGLLCPRCEESLDTHNEEKCRRRMTRRHFVGIWGAAVAVAYGGDKILVATESQVKAIEAEFKSKTWMVSHRAGRVSSSLIHNPEPGERQTYNIMTNDAGSWYSPHSALAPTRNPAIEVLKLRALGFNVQLSNDIREHEAQSRSVTADIIAGRVPDTDPNSEFPSVYRW